MSCYGVDHLSRNHLSLSAVSHVVEDCEAVEGRCLQTAPQPDWVQKDIVIHLEDMLDFTAFRSDPLEKEGGFESEI